jgi:Na+/proline symporter
MIEMAGILGYLVVQLLLGVWVSRKIRDEKDYFLAGRSLGVTLTTFSIFATWFGAETCIGSAGAIFEGGLSASRADPFGYTVCLLLLGMFFARKLWALGLTTIADLYRLRYSGTVEKLAVWIMVPSSLLWAAAQIRAFGQIVSSTGVINTQLAVTFAALVVIVYTTFGGLMGDVATDFVQGLFLILGLGVLLFAAVDAVGGITPALQAVAPSKITLLSPGESIWQRLDAWMVPILGSLVAQELISRVLAARSSGVARSSSFLASGLYFTVGLIPVVIGLMGPAFNLQVDDPEQFLPTLARQLLPTFLYIIFAGALISAILSTVDSTLLTISALVSHNFVTHFLRAPSEALKVSVARAVVVLSGLAAFVIALYADGIYTLIEMSSYFGTPGVLVVTVFALHSKFGGAPAAAAALITGVVATPVAEHVLELQAPFMASVTASLIAFVGVELFMHSKAGAGRDVTQSTGASPI